MPNKGELAKDAAIFTMGAIAAYSVLRGNHTVQQIPEDILPPSIPPISDTATPVMMQPAKEVLELPETRKQTIDLIDRYLSRKAALQDVMQRSISLDETRVGAFAKDTMQKLAFQTFVDGIALHQTVSTSGNGTSVAISEDRNTALVAGWEFDLNHLFGFHIASSVVHLELENYNLELKQQEKIEQMEKLTGYGIYLREDMQTDISRMKARQKINQSTIENILWLAGENPPIEIDKDAFAFLPPEYLDNHAKILRSLQQAQLPAPRLVRYVRHAKDAYGGGWYWDHTRPEELRFTIEITNNSGKDSVVHEIGHYISDASHEHSDNHLAEISQEEFERQVSEAIALYGPEVKDIKNAFLSFKKNDPNAPHLVEEYANRFRQYFVEGRKMRQQLARLRVEDPGAFEIAKVMYEFMRKVWREGEFIDAGNPVIQKYTIGAVVLVKDEDRERPGVFLRPKIGEPLKVTFPVVFNNDEVEIMDGPFTITTESRERVYWRVKIIKRSNEDLSRIRLDFEVHEGMIPEEYLGEILEAIKN